MTTHLHIPESKRIISLIGTPKLRETKEGYAVSIPITIYASDNGYYPFNTEIRKTYEFHEANEESEALRFFRLTKVPSGTELNEKEFSDLLSEYRALSDKP